MVFVGCRAVTAQELLDLATDRALSEQELELLSGLVVQNNVEEIARTRGADAPTLAEACPSELCQSQILDALQRAGEQATEAANRPSSRSGPPELFGWTGNVFVPRAITGSRDDYVITNVAPASYPPDLRAVPLPRADPDAVTTGDAITGVLSPNSLPTQLIEADLLRQGQSRRTFAIRRDISDEAKSAAVAALVAAGLEATLFDESAEQPASLIEPVDVVSFEGAEEGVNCTGNAGARAWPYDVPEVVGILEENLLVMQRLRLPLRRAVVIVADTGIGADLVREGTGGLRSMLAPNASELLNPMVLFNNANVDLPGSFGCEDHDQNHYFGDVYGAVGSELNVRLCTPDTARPPFDDRLAPVPPREGASETYEPSHGSFVATLAAGGPDLLSAYPDISRQIGLRIFRTTRPTEIGSSKSVRVDPADVTGAVEYALTQGVAVLNMSMKTTDSNLAGLFDGAVARSDTLVVTSAGNRAEQLDLPSNRVFPAGLVNRNLIVVGGLADDDQRSWWADSAVGEGHVTIAAPAVRVKSVDQIGRTVCYSGTSAAAPIVSFTAAVLLSYGLLDSESAKDRILGSAEPDRIAQPDQSLRGRVRNARKLDVPAALDIFTDRIRLTGADGTIRGRIVVEPGPRLIPICDAAAPAMAGSKGMVDPARLRSWHRTGSQAVFDLTTANDVLAQCPLPAQAQIRFRRPGGDEVELIDLADVDSMVLSSFRSPEVEAAVLQEGGQ